MSLPLDVAVAATNATLRDPELAPAILRVSTDTREIEPAVRDDVQGAQALGGARRVVVVRDHLADAVTDADEISTTIERLHATDALVE